MPPGKQNRTVGAVIILIIFALIGLGFLITDDIPSPSKTVTKTIEHEALK